MWAHSQSENELKTTRREHENCFDLSCIIHVVSDVAWQPTSLFLCVFLQFIRPQSCHISQMDDALAS